MPVLARAAGPLASTACLRPISPVVPIVVGRRQARLCLRPSRCAASGSGGTPTGSEGGPAPLDRRASEVIEAACGADLEGCGVESSPELAPLREALLRARRRRDEASARREALEAEAQEVAQLEVNAEAALDAARRELAAAKAELAQLLASQPPLDEGADAAAAAAAGGPAEKPGDGAVESRESSITGGASGMDSDEVDSVILEEDAAATAADTIASTDTPEQPLPDATVESSPIKEEEESPLAVAQARVIALELRVAEAREAYEAADRVANAAMDAAEDGVREEMECIAVFKEVEEALAKTIQGLRQLDSNTGRQGQDWGRASSSSKAAAAVSEAADVAQAGVPATGAAAADAKKRAGETTAEGGVAGIEERKDGKPVAGSTGAPGVAAKAAAAGTVAGPAATLSPATATTLAAPGGAPAAAFPTAAAQAAQAAAARRSAMKYAVYGLVAVAGLVAAERLGFWTLLASAANEVAARISAGMAYARSLASALPLPHVHIHDSEKGLLETIWLLLSSVITVPLICKLPGGSAVLGFLAGGALIGPYALGIIQNVSSVRHIAELGVVFLLFNIGLELSFDRLASMGKMVFGMGAAQVCLTLAAVASVALALCGTSLGGAGAIILGGGLALSTTAVGMQVLADRGETGSRHGRAAFSVLLFQDLAVVVLLMLIPLLTPSPENAAASGMESLLRIARAVGVAGVKAVACMGTITVAGRVVLQPLYRRVAETRNPDIFAAMTLLVVLGTSLITQLAGLSLALGAFLAGLLLAETPFHLQIEADIAPYKGLLMGLFFMTVGMEISVGLLFARLRSVMVAMALLIAGKVALMTGIGQVFGLSTVQALRAGLLLSPGGEFAFVLFGEAVARGILAAGFVQEMYLVVALTMALTPFLAMAGARAAKLLESKDMGALQPKEKEVGSLSDHVIIAGFGRVGRLIGEMLSEQLIPFVALDVDPGRVTEGRAQDLPVYFGDAGSPAVLHALRAEKAACAVITLDTPAANYRSVWALHKHFPNVKTFVRAHDVDNGLQLERAGATAVVPETLEPSLQLAAAVLTEMDIPEAEVAESIRDFRRTHLSDLQVLARNSGSSLGYEVAGEALRSADRSTGASQPGGSPATHGTPQAADSVSRSATAAPSSA